MASNNPDSSANQSAVSSFTFHYAFGTSPGLRTSQISEDPKTDVNAAVEELLNTISNKFAGVSSEIFAKMDEMSRRLDNLEAALLANKEKDAGPSKSS
ncbi:heat shock factor binding protein 1 [Colletotrichum nymphaeae SA-01]|uniref:Heat shock factor binding protein 1 n=1 Tax=Colletotrichum nymphaeae SA-01 TaxID=1460502 RepID=A0A135UVF1_9PEZI|nr:heat shock factor binding protein 1 [Colletotrichum nymphaeae SA-01]